MQASKIPPHSKQTKRIRESNSPCEYKENSFFMLGFICGWIENDKNIK